METIAKPGDRDTCAHSRRYKISGYNRTELYKGGCFPVYFRFTATAFLDEKIRTDQCSKKRRNFKRSIRSNRCHSKSVFRQWRYDTGRIDQLASLCELCIPSNR